MATLFYEPSTRTRLSFESAMLRLGGSVVSTESAGEYSSAAKGETLEGACPRPNVDEAAVPGRTRRAAIAYHLLPPQTPCAPLRATQTSSSCATSKPARRTLFHLCCQSATSAPQLSSSASPPRSSPTSPLLPAGSAKRAAAATLRPLINAGDGPGQHPTQALLDVYTIKKEIGRLDNIKVGLVGDLANGRTVRSLAYLLTKFDNVELAFVAPDVRSPHPS